MTELTLEIILGVIALIWFGILIGIIVHSKKNYGIYQKQKELIFHVNRKGK